MLTVTPKDSSVQPALLKSFLAKFDQQESGCWLWHGATTEDGYGYMRCAGQKYHLAHRTSYRVHVGPIPGKLEVLHTCDVRNCVRPDHLYLGTQVENGRDARLRNRTKYHEENPMSRLTKEKVLNIRRDAAAGATFHALARKYGCHHATVEQVVKHQTWYRLGGPSGHRTRQRLTADQIREIRTSAERSSILARRFGVCIDHIGSIRAGRRCKSIA